MAKCSKKEETITVVKSVTLELSVQEAQLLHHILWTSVLGNGVGRRISDEICETLTEAKLGSGNFVTDGYVEFKGK